MMVKSLPEMLTKRKSQTFYKLMYDHSVANVVCESISSISMWNFVNQFEKHDFFCG